MSRFNNAGAGGYVTVGQVNSLINTAIKKSENTDSATYLRKRKRDGETQQDTDMPLLYLGVDMSTAPLTALATKGYVDAGGGGHDLSNYVQKTGASSQNIDGSLSFGSSAPQRTKLALSTAGNTVTSFASDGLSQAYSSLFQDTTRTQIDTNHATSGVKHSLVVNPTDIEFRETGLGLDAEVKISGNLNTTGTVHGNVVKTNTIDSTDDQHLLQYATGTTLLSAPVSVSLNTAFVDVPGSIRMNNSTANKALKLDASKVVVASNLEIADVNSLSTSLEDKVSKSDTNTQHLSGKLTCSYVPSADVDLANKAYVDYKTMYDIKSVVPLSTGIWSGGLITITGLNRFTVSEIKGEIVDVNNVRSFVTGSYDGPINLAATFVSLYINSSNQFVQEDNIASTPEKRRSMIFIGTLFSNGTSITSAINQGFYLVNPYQSVFDLNKAVGIVNLSGNVYTGNSNQQLNKTAGSLFSFGSNPSNLMNPNTIDTPILAFGSSITRITRNGTQTLATVVDSTRYDVAGSLVPVSTNQWTNQRIYLAANNTTIVQYGQNVYNSSTDALGAINTESFVSVITTSSPIILRYILTVRGAGGTPNLSTTADAIFTGASKFGEVMSSGGSSGAGDVTGPASSTAFGGAFYSGTTGKIIAAPAASLTNGQIYIGSTGAIPVAASITAGTGITLTPGPGSLTITNSNALSRFREGTATWSNATGHWTVGLVTTSTLTWSYVKTTSPYRVRVLTSVKNVNASGVSGTVDMACASAGIPIPSSNEPGPIFGSVCGGFTGDANFRGVPLNVIGGYVMVNTANNAFTIYSTSPNASGSVQPTNNNLMATIIIEYETSTAPT